MTFVQQCLRPVRWACVAFVACVACAALLASGAQADQAVWHCSKHQQLNISSADEPLMEQDDLFYLASFSFNTIAITLNDLTDIYNGRRVQLGQQALTGCFMAGDTPLNRAAFNSIGLRWSALQLMSRRSAIAQSPLHLVHSEADMLACIVNNFPAVGYLGSAHENDEVAPCF